MASITQTDLHIQHNPHKNSNEFFIELKEHTHNPKHTPKTDKRNTEDLE